jgi:hypothetical protein
MENVFVSNRGRLPDELNLNLSDDNCLEIRKRQELKSVGFSDRLETLVL